MLKGFGFIGSTSFFKSSVQPDLNNPAVELPGLSDRVTSATVYFERRGFEARVSARYRSDYRGDIATFGPRGEVFRNLQSETVVDAQVSYNFRSGPMEGLSIILQGYNLTDEPLFATQGYDTRLVQDYQRYGASYSVGVSYKF
jgi:iron complex outermembrane recepter protein